MKYLAFAIAAVCALSVSAAAQESLTIEGKTISVKYAGQDATGQKIIGPVAFHTDADLAFKGFSLPKGNYSLYVAVGPAASQLIVNKQTGGGAATHNPKADVGRAAMVMGKAAAPAAKCTVKLTKTAALAAKIELAWENTTASAPFFLDRAGEHSEW